MGLCIFVCFFPFCFFFLFISFAISWKLKWKWFCRDRVEQMYLECDLKTIVSKASKNWKKTERGRKKERMDGNMETKHLVPCVCAVCMCNYEMAADFIFFCCPFFNAEHLLIAFGKMLASQAVWKHYNHKYAIWMKGKQNPVNRFSFIKKQTTTTPKTMTMRYSFLLLFCYFFRHSSACELTHS